MREPEPSVTLEGRRPILWELTCWECCFVPGVYRSIGFDTARDLQRHVRERHNRNV